MQTLDYMPGDISTGFFLGDWNDLYVFAVVLEIQNIYSRFQDNGFQSHTRIGKHQEIS